MASLSRALPGHLGKGGQERDGQPDASIQHKVVQDKDGNTNVVWDMAGAPYWAFVEKGVKGAVSDAKAPDSPFKFGSGSGEKGTLQPAIRQWIVDKPIEQWQSRKTDASCPTTTCLLSLVATYMNGIAPTSISEPTTCRGNTSGTNGSLRTHTPKTLATLSESS